MVIRAKREAACEPLFIGLSRVQGGATAVEQGCGMSWARDDKRLPGEKQVQKNQHELVCLVLVLMVRKERLELSHLAAPE